MGSADGEYCVESMKSVGGSSIATAGASRGARRSLAKDLKDQEPYSPRLFTKKQLLLLQQQRQYQFLEDHRQQHSQQHQQQAPVNLLNSRRVYPSSSSSRQLLLRNAADFDSSSHGSPLVLPRKVPKKMVVDEKQLAMKLLRARNLVSCSSTSSSSSSSENASLRASAEGGLDFLPRSSLDIPRKSLLSGYGSARSQQIHTLARQKSVSSGASSSSLENDLSATAAAAAEEKIKALSTATMVMSCSGRSSDAEESTSGSSVVRMIMGRNGGYARRAYHHAAPTAPPPPPPVAPMLLRSASCSSAMSSSSSLSKLVRVKAADMGLTMQEHAFYCANQVLDAMDKLHCKRVAWTLKKEFDKAYGPAWHCIVGTSFGSYVTHSVGGFLYFSIGKVSVLLFQTAVELIEHH